MRSINYKALLLLSLSISVFVVSCSDSGTNGVLDVTEDPDVTIAPERTEWLLNNTFPFTTTDSEETDFSDLQPFKEMIGDARVVGLGEATHGTKEFFEMKHRMLRFLVEEMGFTDFAIEATMPEAFAIDHYVKTGEGDPTVLLSNLYFWTWNTQEVLDMILWMRSYNAGQSSENQIGFYGFDMQFPEQAMDFVEDYVEQHQPEDTTFVTDNVQCYRRFQNDFDGYSTLLSSEARNDCRSNLETVFNYIEENGSQFVQLSSQREYELALQHARLILQSEEAAAVFNLAAGTIYGQIRDKAMADNTEWLLDFLGPKSKLVLWAHNYHISDDDDRFSNTEGITQGFHLAQSLQGDYYKIGFSFYQGRFNARFVSPTEGVGELSTHTTILPPPTSLSAHFHTTSREHLFLDLGPLRVSENINTGNNWLASPITYRSIGATYNASLRSLFFEEDALISNRFDAIIYVENSTASELLPFVNEKIVPNTINIPESIYR